MQLVLETVVEVMLVVGRDGDDDDGGSCEDCHGNFVIQRIRLAICTK